MQQPRRAGGIPFGGGALRSPGKALSRALTRVEAYALVCPFISEGLRGGRREAHIPAKSDTSSADAWLPGAHEDRRGTQGHRAAARQGQAAAGALREEEVAFPPFVFDSSRVPRSTLGRADFLRATRRGRRVVTDFFLLFVFDREDAGETRLGITVTRKVGNAVRRNRIKRLVREWFRAQTAEIGSCDLIVIAKRDLPPTLKLCSVQKDLDHGLRRWAEASERSSG
jgi:ribonuclease P protein component